MSILNFTGLSKQGVSANYSDMPPSSKVLFVDETNGAQSGGVLVSGSGSLTIPVTGLAPGDYYLIAHDPQGNWIAQTVVFHV
jgi:hypothetical protein